jgi:pimeloyl-ACP methyl ester carboxylesterase
VNVNTLRSTQCDKALVHYVLGARRGIAQMEQMSFEVEGARVGATLDVAHEAASIIVAVQGTSPRPTKRTLPIAKAARAVGAGFVTVQLLTAEEAAADASTGAVRFDVGLLGRRLARIVDALDRGSQRRLPLTVHASGTAAAAALVAAARQPSIVQAVISSSGRPDLARPVLAKVEAPVLLIVGGKDLHGVRACCDALRYLPRTAQLALVPSAGTTFDSDEDQQALAQLVASWVATSLPRRHK